MDKNIIRERLIEIFRDKLCRDIVKCDNVWEESIFGKNIALLPAEAYFLLVEIEKNFGINFSDDIISDGKFNLLNDICDSIWKLQNGKVV
ncbi:MAG: hypothetical protein K2N73_08685 [Lachnospiraceae bacterium]|nr:hypothetical protein [Lachnospiraceae bacterium]